MRQFYFLFTLFLVQSVSAQTIKAIYSETRILSEKAKEFYSEREQRLKVIPNDFELLYSQEKSIYKKCSYTVDNDSVKYPKTNGVEDFSQPNYVKNVALETKQFKDFAKDSLLYFVPNTDKNYYIKDKMFDWEWKITAETQTIQGYKCTKAISDKFGDVTAWFSSEIPNNAGPLLYHGLPGMILKVERSSAIIELKSILFFETNEAILPFETKDKTFTLNEYQSFLENKLNGIQNRPNTFIIRN